MTNVPMFEMVRDVRGSLVHVRHRHSGECIGCIEVGLFETLRSLILAETKETTVQSDHLREGSRA